MTYTFSYPNIVAPKQFVKKMIALNAIPQATGNRKVYLKVHMTKADFPYPFVESISMQMLRLFRLIHRKQALRADSVEYLINKKDPHIEVTLEDM